MTEGQLFNGSLNDDLTIKQESDATFLSRLASARNQARRLGDQPITVVNLNPYKLVVPHSMWAGLDVPARDMENQRYAAKVITEIKYQRLQGIEKTDDAVATFWPIQLAEEFVNAQARNNAGGVFLVKGDLKRNPELERTPEFAHAYAEADRYMIEYCTRLKAAADNEWNSVGHANAKNIQEPHRRAARVLIARRMLAAENVPWLDVVRSEADIAIELCPVCKTEPKKGALVCIACNEILDPARAFLERVIPETHISLEKLSRKQVNELGIGAYVAETVDERPLRLKSGLPKPLSAYERNMAVAQAAAAAEPVPSPAKHGKSA